jgi:dolichyl-phosphate beta-glucosyltransferase
LSESDAIDLSLIFPAYNESERIPVAIRRVYEFFEASQRAVEVIVVDDGSSDDTSAAASRALSGKAGGNVLTLPRNCGKGAAVRAGVMASQGRFVLFSDADLSTPISDEAKLRAALEAGADIAIGTRAVRESKITLRQSLVRESMGRTFNLLIRVLGLSRFSDTQCGFKMFTLEAARALFPVARVQGFAFDVEVLYLAERAGFRVVEVPVEWRNDPDSRVRKIRDSARMIIEVLRIRWMYAPWKRNVGVSPRPKDAER